MSEGFQDKVVPVVVAALLIGAITQGVVLYSSSQVTNQRLENMTLAMQELKADLKQLRANTSDRWRKPDHDAYAVDVNNRISKVWDAVGSVRDEQAKRTGNVYRVDALAKDVQDLKARLAQHAADPAHADAGRRLDALLLRVRKLEGH